jgi:CRISPR-associated endonuclease Cas1
MAATKTVTQLPQTYNSVSRPGVLTLFGYGIQVFVDRGHLSIEDGIGTERSRHRLPRVGHGLKRLVVIGSDGMVSLAALRWLADQNVAFVMLERDGSVLVTTGPVRASDARLRRAQSLASHSGAAMRIARELIDKKLAGQEQVARHKLHAHENADAIHRHRSELAEADTPDSVRLIESRAASAYWAAWRTLSITYPRKDESRIPERWRTFEARISPLSGSPRLAVNPANAILNYLYAVLESESRLAAAALGLDPGIGMLHVDTPYRDSLACDLMEPVRPQVDAYFLDWISREPLKKEWFAEQRDGNCRLMGSFATQLSATAPTWGRAVAPFAEWIAQTLRTPERKPVSRDQRVPTRLTQRRRSEGRGKDHVLDTTLAPHPKNVCRGCGTTTLGGRHCPKCGREVSREKLIELAKAGRQVALSRKSRMKHSETQRRHRAAQREWLATAKPDWLTEHFYHQEIQPKLAAITISLISSTLGVSETYAADIRAGRHRPHPRHWEKLAALGPDSASVNSLTHLQIKCDV